MSPQPPDPAADPDAVADDEQLIEDLRTGAQPPSHDDVARLLATWRDATSTPTGPWIYQQLADERLVDVPAAPAGRDPATTMLPAQTVRYGDAVDWVKSPGADPVARTAGEEDHSNPWFYAGDDADPPGAP